MQERTHQEVTRLAAELVGWPKDMIDEVATEAATFDRLHVLEVEGLGFHGAGVELVSLLHFGRRVLREDRKGFQMDGYSYRHDKSGPHLDLPDRRVISHAENWRWPITPEMRLKEPLLLLLAVPGINVAADEITFPAASSYGDWFEWCIAKLPPEWGEARLEAICHLCGFGAHVAQDLCGPYHADGMVLGGHAAFEGDQQESFVRLLAKAREKPPSSPPGLPMSASFRAIAEKCAGMAYVAPSVLAWEAQIHHPYWHQRVDASVRRALGATMLLLRSALDRYLSPILSAAGKT